MFLPFFNPPTIPAPSQGEYHNTKCTGNCWTNDLFGSKNTFCHLLRVSFHLIQKNQILFNTITCIREILGQAWMKAEKKEKAPHICLITERFNDVSNWLLSISQSKVTLIDCNKCNKSNSNFKLTFLIPDVSSDSFWDYNKSL